MNAERAKRMETLYSNLRSAYSLLASEDNEYSICGSYRYGYVPILALTPDEIKTIAKWKIEALEAELLADQESKP